MKKIIKQGLMIGLIALFSVNLTACNKTQEKFIEVGLSNDHGSMVSNPWDEFYTGLKAKTQKGKTQEIEVVYGQRLGPNYSVPNDMYVVDWNQNLEFKLTKYIYSRDDDGIYNIVEKFEEILVIINTLKYFISEEFDFRKNSIIDTIEANDLVQKNGLIYYSFIITPLGNEPIRLYEYSRENPGELLSVFGYDKIKSHYNCYIEYTIDNQNQITFLEKEEVRKNINV